MDSHQLARILLRHPNLPVATIANGHTFHSGVDEEHLKIGILDHYTMDHIIIGNISKRNINKPNWFVREMIHGEAPEEW